MSNEKDMPVHTPKVVLELEVGARSFNELQMKYALSPSTLSRILKFLRQKQVIDVEIREPEGRGIRKVYSLNKKGRVLVKPMKKFEELRGEILDMIGK